MNIRPSFSRRLVLLLVAVGALVALVSEVGSAGATTATSPTIDPQSPPEGAAVAATGEGLKVTFSCPSFVYEEGETEVIEEENEEEELEVIEEIEGPPVLGNAENYGVHFSVLPNVDQFGQLGTAGFDEAGEGEAEEAKGTGVCGSELELPSGPRNPATLYEGKVYWQAYRESTFGANEIEVGPVRSFNVSPNVEEPELTFREQIFAGYLTKVGLSYEAELGGAVVKLQEWEGSAWKTIAEAPGSNRGENAFFVKLTKSGRHVFRPLVEAPGVQNLGLESAAKAVRKPSKHRVTSAADDGSYIAANKKEQKESPIAFQVQGGGTILRNLTAEAETTCAGPTKSQNVTIEVGAYLRNAKVAPDGTVFGVTKSKGPEEWTVTLTGSIFHGRFQGELTTAHANCTGYRVIDAVLSKGK